MQNIKHNLLHIKHIILLHWHFWNNNRHRNHLHKTFFLDVEIIKNLHKRRKYYYLHMFHILKDMVDMFFYLNHEILQDKSQHMIFLRGEDLFYIHHIGLPLNIYHIL